MIMRKLWFSFTFFCITFFATAQTLQQLESKRVKLSNGWSLTPAGKSFSLGDLPLNIALSSSKKYMAVTNNGHGVQTIQLIDVKNEKVISSIVIPVAWYGL